jgi:hypothetical protein
LQGLQDQPQAQHNQLAQQLAALTYQEAPPAQRLPQGKSLALVALQAAQLAQVLALAAQQAHRNCLAYRKAIHRAAVPQQASQIWLALLLELRAAQGKQLAALMCHPLHLCHLRQNLNLLQVTARECSTQCDQYARNVQHSHAQPLVRCVGTALPLTKSGAHKGSLGLLFPSVFRKEAAQESAGLMMQKYSGAYVANKMMT